MELDVQRLKIRLGEMAAGLGDELLAEYLQDAAQEAREYCGVSALPDGAAGAVLDLACARIQRRGLESETAHSEGGVSMTLSAGMPEGIAARLRRYRVVRMI